MAPAADRAPLDISTCPTRHRVPQAGLRAVVPAARHWPGPNPEPLPYDEARAREIVGNYENDTMDLTIDSTDEPGLRLEVRMKPEVRAAYKEMPLDHAPFDLSLLPRRRRRVHHHQRRPHRAAGFFTRDESGAVVGAEFAGRLYGRVPTAPKVKPGVRSRTGQEPKHCVEDLRQATNEDSCQVDRRSRTTPSPRHAPEPQAASHRAQNTRFCLPIHRRGRSGCPRVPRVSPAPVP